MRRILGMAVAFVLGAGLATALVQKASDRTDSTIVDPDVHQVVFENDHVRVLDARIAPGWKSPMHTHPPLLLISCGSGRLKLSSPDGSTQVADFSPGMVLWRGATEHSWELLAGDAHVFGVEVKSAQGE